MRDIRAFALTIGSVLALTGCATTDHVLFVTKTSLGIDFDSKPPSASIAYDRIEGYIAPRYDNGEIPPVIASVKSDGAIFSPQIRQVYATGDAAEIVLSGTPPAERRKLKGNKKLMFFGTTTTTGLKVGFGTSLPDSLTFGFKRKEFSFIPLGTQEDAEGPYDVYPSIIASIDTVTTAGTPSDTGFRNTQFFATGEAARLLAANPGVRKDFVTSAIEALTAKEKAKPILDEQSIQKQKLMDYLTASDGSIDTQNLNKLLGMEPALSKVSDAQKQKLMEATTASALRERLDKAAFLALAGPLHEALEALSNN